MVLTGQVSLSVRVRGWRTCYLHESPLKDSSVCVCVHLNTLSSLNIPRTFHHKQVNTATDKLLYLPVLTRLGSSPLSGGKSSPGNMSDAQG